MNANLTISFGIMYEIHRSLTMLSIIRVEKFIVRIKFLQFCFDQHWQVTNWYLWWVSGIHDIFGSSSNYINKLSINDLKSFYGLWHVTSLVPCSIFLPIHSTFCITCRSIILWVKLCKKCVLANFSDEIKWRHIF